jgi:hypothetical protein
MSTTPARASTTSPRRSPTEHSPSSCNASPNCRSPPSSSKARYSALYKLEHVNGNWFADQLARLEVRYPEVHLVFADSRRYAEDWTYRFLTTALADATGADS